MAEPVHISEALESSERNLIAFNSIRDGLARCALWWWSTQAHPYDSETPADMFIHDVAALVLGNHVLGIFGDNVSEDNFVALLERGRELEQGDWADFLAIL